MLADRAALRPKAPGKEPSSCLPAPEGSWRSWALAASLQTLSQLHMALPALCVCAFGFFSYFFSFSVASKELGPTLIQDDFM